MLGSFPAAVTVGALLGYLSGLGVGGGSLLILWLTLVLGMPQSVARSINLMFFITAAGAVSLFRWRHGALNGKVILPAVLAGCCSAVIFSLFSRNLDVTWLKKLFGLLLLITGVRELCYRPRKAR